MHVHWHERLLWLDHHATEAYHMTILDKLKNLNTSGNGLLHEKQVAKSGNLTQDMNVKRRNPKLVFLPSLQKKNEKT